MRLLLSLALLALSRPGASPFDGRWVIDMTSMEHPPAITTISLDHGGFSRWPMEDGPAVRADGRVHAIRGDGYVDAVSAVAIGSRRMRETDWLRDRRVYVVTYDVSADGGAMTKHIVDWSKPDGKPIVTVIHCTRVGHATNGNMLSGKWQEQKVSTSKDHLSDTLRLAGDHFSKQGPGGFGYEAVIGGPAVPVRGDAATARIAVEMPDARTIIEHGSLDGKPTMTVTMTIQRDGRTINAVMKRVDGSAGASWVMRKE